MTNDSIALDIRDLRKSFDDKVVLSGISLALKSGEIVAILGASGSGKSVLLKTIIGLVRPDSGSIRFKGMDLAQLTEREFYAIRAEIGYVFQDGALFDSLTVEENLEYPLKLHSRWKESQSEAYINERLASLDVAGTNSLYPDELSGGMRKRVGLLRATMLQPELILLDEPTAGLDPANIARFSRTVEMIKMTRGMTAIFVTHDLPCAFAISDRVGLLNGGLLYAIGTPDEMRQSADPIVRDFLFPEYRWKGQGKEKGQTA
jgi:phospholipid/cholesterol/gamma-HCH transport system ATP-binding protein